MDPRLLEHYERELEHLRGMAAEFAETYPKIAGRLGIDQFECHDPYVERLLEGFAFLTARVQLKLASQFPRFTQHLLEIVYPHYLAPIPSTAVVAFRPDTSDGALVDGVTVPRQSVLRTLLGRADRTACEYRTAHAVTLWPFEVAQANYYSGPAAVAGLELPDLRGARAALRLRLQLPAATGLTFDKLALDELVLFLRGSDSVPHRLHEQLLGNVIGIVVRSGQGAGARHVNLPARAVRPMGFADDEALLPAAPRSFSGYRLLQEYFVLPQRFLFVALEGLREAVRRAPHDRLDIVFLFGRSDAMLSQVVDKDNFALYCTPAANVFPKQADRIHLAGARSDQHHVVVDRTRPYDYEVYDITAIEGYGTSAEPEVTFHPFYAMRDAALAPRGRAFYTLTREPRVLSEKARRHGPRSSYAGGEIYVSLVDADEAPYRQDLRQLAVSALCTNRDLPLALSFGGGTSDFTLDLGLPVQSVRCLVGPTRPRPSRAAGEVAWKTISHLSLNYLSLQDDGGSRGVEALREILALYGDIAEAGMRRHIEGVVGLVARPAVRRLPSVGPVAFARGLEIEVTLEEQAFEGLGAFLLGAVLDAFFARHVSINSFTETVVRTSERGEVMRWPIRIGQRQIW